MNNLKKLRENAELSMRELADCVKMSYTTVYWLESEKRPFRQEHIAKLCAFFGVTSDYLLGRADSGEKTKEVKRLIEEIKDSKATIEYWKGKYMDLLGRGRGKMADTYDIVPEKMGESYVLAHYDAMEASAFSFVKEFSLPHEIECTSDYEFAKDAKSKLSKIKKAFTRKRLDVNDILMADYNTKMRSIEKILEAGEEELKGKIERYETGTLKKEPKKKLITLEIKSYDEEALSKAEAYAKKLGLDTRYTKGK